MSRPRSGKPTPFERRVLASYHYFASPFADNIPPMSFVASHLGCSVQAVGAAVLALEAQGLGAQTPGKQQSFRLTPAGVVEVRRYRRWLRGEGRRELASRDRAERDRVLAERKAARRLRRLMAKGGAA